MKAVSQILDQLVLVERRGSSHISGARLNELNQQAWDLYLTDALPLFTRLVGPIEELPLFTWTK